MFHLDAGNSESYGDQTTLWKDLTSNNNDFSNEILEQRYKYLKTN